MSVRWLFLVAMASTLFGATGNAQTLHYQGSAVTGDSVTVDLSVLDRLGPPPSLPQLLRPGSVTPQQLTPPPGMAASEQDVEAQRTARLRQPPAGAPKSTLNVPAERPAAAAPRRPAPAPAAAPKAAAPQRPAPQQPPPRVAKAPPAPKTPPPAPAARTPPPAPPKVAATTMKPEPKEAPARQQTAARATAPKPAEPVKPAAAPKQPAPRQPATAAKPAPAPKAPAPAPKTPEPPKVVKPSPAEETKPAPATAKVPAPKPAEMAKPSAPKQVAAVPGEAIERDGGLTITFAPGSSDLPDNAVGALDRLAEDLKSDPNMRIQLVGFARTQVESPSQARRLSLFRALSVRTHLMKKGVRSTRMDVRALGNKEDDGPPDRVDLVVPSGS